MYLTKTQSVIGGLVLLLASSASYAERICVHGHSGMLQDTHVDYFRHGSGLIVFPTYLWKGYERGGEAVRQGDWVHYSIPVDTDRYYNRIRIRVFNAATHQLDQSWIDEAHVYAGETTIKEKTLNTDSPSRDYVDVYLDAPGRFWNSIGVSLKLTTLEAGEWIQIASVCAFE